MERQATDGANPLPHESIIVLYIADQFSASVVHGDKLVQGTAGPIRGERMMGNPGIKQNVSISSLTIYTVILT